MLKKKGGWIMFKKVITSQSTCKKLNTSAFTYLIKFLLLMFIATLLTIGVQKSSAWALSEIESGDCLSGEIETPSSMVSYIFYGEAGQAVVITATASSGPLYPELILYTPDGMREISSYDNDQARIENHTLTQTGWHAIVVEDYNGKGGIHFTLV
jgi:hypothetical protein